MRIVFTSTTRAKKAAKLLGAESSQPLANCQQQVAKVCGYRDWHDLEQAAVAHTGTVTQPVAIDTQVEVIAALAQKLRLAVGDVQHAVATARLFGSAAPDLRDAIEVRRRLFVATDLPPPAPGEPGSVVALKLRRGETEPAILRTFGSAVTLITQSKLNMGAADFEISTPRMPLPLFIPWRLYFPYGVWTEADSSRVVFSRDYCPLWRVRADRAPERMYPWEWIKYDSSERFWGEGPIDWDEVNLEANAIRLLESFGVRSMPCLVDLLPLLISKNCSIGDAVSESKKRYEICRADAH